MLFCSETCYLYLPFHASCFERYTSSFDLPCVIHIERASHCLQWHHQKDKGLLGMFRKNSFSSLRLWFALSSASMLPPAFFLDTLSLKHRPLEF